MMRVGALAMVVSIVAVPAFGNFINVNFCDCSTNVLPEVLQDYAPLVAALSSDPDADMNGDSSMEDTETFKCEVGGNAIPDCSCELGLVSALLVNQDVDFTAFEGVSHEMVYDVFVHNRDTLHGYLGLDYDVLVDLLEPLLWLIYGHLMIGDGMFEEVAPDQYDFSGSGGYAISLIYALPTTSPILPEAIDLANYWTLPQYLASNSDADGDGFTNIEEYMASASTAEYVAGALDRTRCGSEPIGEGEEGEGEEGEGEEGEGEEGEGEEGEGEEGEGEEGEGEEGEGEPVEDPPMPATTGFAPVLLLLILLGSGILLRPRVSRCKSRYSKQ